MSTLQQTLASRLISKDTVAILSPLFELRQFNGKGFGLFAKVDLEPGTILYAEKPLLVFAHTTKPIYDREVIAAYDCLSSAQKEVFNSLRDPGDALPPTYRHPSQLHRRLYANTWSCDGTTSVFRTSSRLNHSCLPNTSCRFTVPRNATESVQHVCYAIRPIAAGEELTVLYEDCCQIMTTAERTAHISGRRLRFDMDHCACELCSLDLSTVDVKRKQQISDMRRMLLRHLYFMITGHDLTGVQSAIDPATQAGYLARRAEEEEQGRTMRAACFAKLAEAEGLEAREL